MRASAWRFALALVAILLPLGMAGPVPSRLLALLFADPDLGGMDIRARLGWIFEADTPARKRMALGCLRRSG